MTKPVRTILAIAPLLAALLLATAPAGASAASRKPVITKLRCVPVKARGCARSPSVAVGGQVQLSGRNLVRAMRVSFRWDRGALATTLTKKKTGWFARVPAGTRPGKVKVTVLDRAKRRSNARTITVKPKVVLPPTKAAATAPGVLPDAFKGDGMWIWQVEKSEGGDLAAIAARANAAGIETVFVKSADGATAWDQFSPALIASLKAAGLRVCAWQFVYGKHPEDEADAALAGIRNGADCFVVDAESDYDGKYRQAQAYMNRLRTGAGEGYPIGFTSFPYVHYHARVPYSVFLGPGGAQANLPQVYWKAIKKGDGGVDEVSALTFQQNRIYQVPLAPIGQSYDKPTSDDVQRFRQVWASYGADGLSWWSWQASTAETWTALGQPAPASVGLPDPGWPALRARSTGDQVVWLQQHLATFDASVPVDGDFGPVTDAALKAFQASKGLPPTGVTDPATWQAMLSLPVRPVDWSTS